MAGSRPSPTLPAKADWSSKWCKRLKPLKSFRKPRRQRLRPSSRSSRRGVAPALVDTPLVERMLSTPEKRAAMDARYPLKRVGTPSDAAAVARFLLSEESSWITGQVISISGGFSMV